MKPNYSSYDINGDGIIERAEVDKANNPRSTIPKQKYSSDDAGCRPMRYATCEKA